jgi:superfamily II DNA or RNA helicase
MQGRKKVTKKQDISPSTTINTNDIENIIKHAALPSFDIDVAPHQWVPPNRVKFPTWLDAAFKYPNAPKSVRCSECSSDGACPTLKADSITLFPHQKLIKDYIQFDSPYRGLLLYHGLGVGKSCSAIAAAELLMNHMDVVVMLPASLRGNFINEIKKCGRRFYNTKQHWVFVPIKQVKVKSISGLARVDATVIEENEGLWIPQNKPGSQPNYAKLPTESQKQIMQQIDSIINNKYQFINYNGLKQASILELSKNGNPFDGKCIVVDEIHNLVSRIVNGGKIGSSLYKLLMSAKNCKLILLSGTPIINYPYEIAYLLNLVIGPRKQYALNVSKTATFDVDKITNLLESENRIDHVSCDPNSRTIKFTFLPNGFEYVNRQTSQVRKLPTSSSSSSVDDDDFVEELADKLREQKVSVLKKVSTIEYKALPEDEKEFNRYFVNMDKATIVNPNMFSRRILGAVSYYSTYSPELYPRLEIIESFEPMTDIQFEVYQASRSEERLKESKSKHQGGEGNIFKDKGQVYRFYSRANCNFVFPSAIKRPFPNMKQIVSEIDDDENGVDQIAKFVKEEKEDEADAAKKKKAKEYDHALQQAIDNLASSPEKFLDIKNIGKYSPKFQQILKRLQDLRGSAMIYSQFRRVEGLGILAKAMSLNGYCEFKIKKQAGEWVLDVAEEDMNKPKYIVFTGNNEETQVLLRIFNSDMENIPPKIKAKLEGQAKTNLFGEIIKVLMITQSGAEGISLKNVQQVHIVEPYWNYVRIDQVIGRAVRTCSHVDLPPNLRKVTVFIYNVRFTKEQLEKSFTLRVKDNSMTSDEYIYTLAKKKNSIIKMFLDVLKQASIDCGLNAKDDASFRCFSFPVNLKASDEAYAFDLKDELFDDQREKGIEKNIWKGSVLVTKKGNFLIRPDTNEVYDYDIYLTGKKLVRIGVLKVVDNKKHIVRD